MVSVYEARDELRRIRDDNTRESERVCELWDACLCKLAYKLGDEQWVVIEQVFTAALDCHRRSVVEETLGQLRKQFPGSQRIKRLIAMRCEAAEMYEHAENKYKKMIEEDETNMIARKRMIAMLKAQGKVTEAIKELVNFLQKFMSDYDAWMELCDLYLSRLEYRKAAFCMEEVLLSNPHNHLYLQRYAEIRYSEACGGGGGGGAEGVDAARKYFAQAARLCDTNVRALFGLFLASSQLAQSPKVAAALKRESQESAAWAATRISQIYKSDPMNAGAAGTQMLCLEGLLDGLKVD